MASGLEPYGSDIYTEPDADPDTLANLGPLTAMAGVWEGTFGADEHPVAEGIERDAFVEHYELQPIDPQTNGPQLFYGLRYHTHIVKPVRGRDVPRPGRLLAVGARDQHGDPDPRDPARPGAPRRRQRRS